jgi:signal transduction histidine kinase
MEIDLLNLTRLLTTPPGNFLYHLVVGLSLMLIGGLSIPKLNNAAFKTYARHALIGCSILLILQIILFGASLVDTLSPSTLTLLESLTSVLTILWLVWLFYEEDTKFFLNGINIFLTLAFIIIATAVQTLTVVQDTQIPINIDIVLITWLIASLLLIAIGLVFITKKRPSQWIIAVCILGILAVGYALQIIKYEPQNPDLGVIRLSQILSLPWLIVIVHRFTEPKAETAPMPAIPKHDSNEKRVDTKPTLVDYLLRIPIQETSQEKYKATARGLSLSLLSDICCIFKVSDKEDKIEMLAGYDLIRETFLNPVTLSNKSLPHLLETWGENRILKLSQSCTESRDFEPLTGVINYPRLGNLLAYPLHSATKPLSGGIIFLSPYTDKLFGDESIALLDKIKPTLSKLLFKPTIKEGLKAELQKAEQSIEQLIKEKDLLQSELLEKETALDEQELALKQWRAKVQVETLEKVNRIEKMQEQIDNFAAQSAQKEKYSPQLEQMRANIRQLTNERDQLKSELAKAKARIEMLTIEKGQTGPIRLSMDTRVVSLDSLMANVRLKLAPQLASTRANLEITNPDGRQMIKTDPELAQTILFGLLDNAIKASRPGGKITVNQQLSLETGMLLIEVTDYGEGLTPGEQKSLFSAQPEMNPGVGSIQSIREAIRAIRVLNGKIWLKSKKNSFTTFRVQLPVRIID